MPPKKSNEAKKALGTYRKDRDPSANIILLPAEKIPPPYTPLNKRQTELYYLAANYIAASMPLMQVDSFALVQMAITLELTEKAKDGIQTQGAIQVYAKTGARAVSPEVQLYEKAVFMLAKLGSLFGLSPKDRMLLMGTMNPEPDKPDPLDDF